ncbi:insulinoma-associated protein 2-like [Arapaima gigas]
MPRGFLVKRSRWISTQFCKIRHGDRKRPEAELLCGTRSSGSVGSPPRCDDTVRGSVPESEEGFFAEAQHRHGAEHAGGATMTTERGDTRAGPVRDSVDASKSTQPDLEISIVGSRFDNNPCAPFVESHHTRPHADLSSFFTGDGGDDDAHQFSSHRCTLKRTSTGSGKEMSSFSVKPKAATGVRVKQDLTLAPVVELKVKRTRDSKPGKKPLAEFICQLCKVEYPDPLALAQHRCSRIARVDYRCAECDKAFSCPANLASHRRWHKPRPARPEQLHEGRRWTHGQLHGARVRAPQHETTGRATALASPRVASHGARDARETHAQSWSFSGHGLRQKDAAPRACYRVGSERVSFPCHFCGVRFPSAGVRDEHAMWHAETEAVRALHASELSSLGVLCLEEQIFLCVWFKSHSCYSTFHCDCDPELLQ